MLVIVKMKGANFIKSAIFEKAGQMIIEEVKKKQRSLHELNIAWAHKKKPSKKYSTASKNEGQIISNISNKPIIKQRF